MGSGSSSAPKTVPPFGLLEVSPMILDRPEELFDQDPPQQPYIAWFFEGRSVESLLDFIGEVGLTSRHLSQITDTNRWRVTPQGIWVYPEAALIHDLTPESRRKVYEVLAQSPNNPQQHHPFTFQSNGVDDWFRQCDLSQKTQESMRKMTYWRGEKLCFADNQYFSLTLPQQEFRCLRRALSRVPTLMMNLRVTPDSNIAKLLDYWGSSDRSRSLKLLLESMARVPGGASINVAYFFPPVPRLQIYTYPSPTKYPADAQPDCFWTSFNFFSQSPDDRFLDVPYARNVLNTQYHQVPEASRFGDLILFYQSSPVFKPVHLCVYIADDVVFTKNGRDLYQPWILMRMQDVRQSYTTAQPLSTWVYRRNSESQ